MGNILCAEVVTTGGQSAKGEAPSAEQDSQPLTEAALRAFAAQRLQPFKVPRMIRFVDNLATTRTGKISRT
jgi:acyl-coenzyme A synthetase/AMP-(fatty) acid ligase